MELCNTNPKSYMGIDVSQDTLDIYWQEQSYKILNTAADISAFIKAEISCPGDVLCALEATGGCERTACKTLHEHGVKIHVAHPNLVHAFGKASKHFAKTDKLDAILLYKYAIFVGFDAKAYNPLEESHQKLIALRRLAATLEENLHKAQCQLKRMPDVCKSRLEENITFHKKQLADIQQEIDLLIDRNEELTAKRALMTTVKGVGLKTAGTLLAEMPELGTMSRTQAASLLGVAPKTHESGKKSIPGHIKGGRFLARKAVYMVDLVAMRHNPVLRQKYQDLVARGKPKKVALVALMRTIIITLNAMLKRSTPYVLSA
jgi:transposase